MPNIWAQIQATIGLQINQWQRTTLLDTKFRDLAEDADKRWITTGQPGTIIWLLNEKMLQVRRTPYHDLKYDWQTPEFALIIKKTKRLSPHSENEIWDHEELKSIIYYEPLRRKMAPIALMWDLNVSNHEITYAKTLMEYGNGVIAIDLKHTKLITALRTAANKGEGTLDKEATSHDDVLDSPLTYRGH